MKTNLKFSIIVTALVIASALLNNQAAAQQGYFSTQVFYDELSPYGKWIDYQNYGYVWFPDAGPEFAPYSTQGQWVYTNYGWTWVSNYPWGWAPFHYGRWDYDNFYGWFWVPDMVWGPSWVNWRSAEGYYGWRPMSPENSNYFGSGYDSFRDHWIFVRNYDLGRYNIADNYANRNDYDWIFSNSATLNNTYHDGGRNTIYYSGPLRADVQNATGNRIRTVKIKENNEPGQELRNRQLRVYKPQGNIGSDVREKSTPYIISNLSEVKPATERNATIRPRTENPYENSRSEQKPDIMNPQNRNNHALPMRTPNANTQGDSNIDRPYDNSEIRNRANDARPARIQVAKPTENENRENKPDIMNPQNRNNNAQPLKQKNEAPPENSKREILRNTEPRQNNSTVEPQSTPQRPVNQSGALRRER